jgi:hypothetical protein
MTRINVVRWQPLALRLDDIGPFRQGVHSFEFRDESRGAEVRNPANMYMLLAPNGRGKTTALNAIYGLFGLMNDPPTGPFAERGETGRAQIDIRASWFLDGVENTVLLSIWTGSSSPLYSWSDTEIEREADAREWAKLGLAWAGGRVTPLDSTNAPGNDFLRSMINGCGEQPTALSGASQDLPTVLLFPADRTIVAPSDERVVRRPENFAYQPAQRFGADGPEWAGSIDNLLVWLEWLDDGRIEDLVTYLNQHILLDEEAKAIRRPHRRELLTQVETRTGVHPLSRLSQGERALLQFYVRTLCHMTANTILLVDEVENHLHPRWMQRLIAAMKTLVREKGRFVTVIFTTHNLELMETFSHNVAEQDLGKGGSFIEREMR